MIKSLKLTNFKCFKNQLLTFRNLTLLSGLNSSGKSSVLQALLLLRQSYQQNLLPSTGLALNGDLVSIGTAQDALFEGAEDDFISFELALKNGLESKWSFNYNQQLDILQIDNLSIESSIYDSTLFSDNFHYLEAERIRHRTNLNVSNSQVKYHRQLGSQGEYTSNFLSFYRDELVSESLHHPKAKSLTLAHEVEAWMGEISPGTKINIKSDFDDTLVSLGYSYKEINPYHPKNVGFGISCILPIIVALLASKPGTLILLEHPEVHLHPKGQSKIGELLALAANHGVQIILETHSDHIFNGVRLAVHSGKIDSTDVQLHHFRHQVVKGELNVEVISPSMNQQGRIDEWPDGFFDEWGASLEALLQPVGETNDVYMTTDTEL